MNDDYAARFALVKAMLVSSGMWNCDKERYLVQSTFQSQNDGGMGSFSVIGRERRLGSKDYAEAKYIDTDGVEIVIALIGDSEGYPTDVDFWKVDNSKLITFPDPSRLTISPIR